MILIKEVYAPFLSDSINKAWVKEAAIQRNGIDIVIPNVSALASGTNLPDSALLLNSALSWLRQSPSSAVVLISSASGREVDMFVEPYGVQFYISSSL